MRMVPPARDGQTLSDRMRAMNYPATATFSGDARPVDRRVLPPRRMDERKSGRTAPEVETKHGSSKSSDRVCGSHRSTELQPRRTEVTLVENGRSPHLTVPVPMKEQEHSRSQS